MSDGDRHDLARGLRTQIDAAPARTVIDPRSAILPSRHDHAAVQRPEPMRLTAGLHVKQFELIRLLGEGGMGQVFLARDTKLGRLVAIKFLALPSPHLIERFLVEARATAQCYHENIVVAYEAGEVDGLPYIVLEYLEGQPLSALLDDRPLSHWRAVDIMIPVARALVRAHELDIVHRDLKPDNIFVTRTAQVKVLDFGIAKLFGHDEAAQRLGATRRADAPAAGMTQHGAIIGTMPYMSPEQWGMGPVDHRSDLWAVGIILWKMLIGRHPVEPATPPRLQAMAAMHDEPLPRIEAVSPGIPAELARVVDACLVKDPRRRLGSAAELLRALELLRPGRYHRRLVGDEAPYPGMAAFEEGDADRFFGRGRDIDHTVQRMRDQALTGIVGPSGVGKSSFIRAGVVPALRASGEPWEILITRPGRDPIAGLATLLQPMLSSDASDLHQRMAEHTNLVHRLRQEPGFFGTCLRGRARQKDAHFLLFVDQFEEIYTLVQDPAERQAFTACLAGMADDPSTPLRVVVAMRSDMLDRAADNRSFMERLSAGLIFLAPIDRQAMREALTGPLEMAGYRFETEAMAEEMLGALTGASGALPLLQFTAAKLWEQRDTSRRILTQASHNALGGVAGALATHADDLLAAFASPERQLIRAIFERLVTSEGTRAVVGVDELDHLSPTPGAARTVTDRLVAARLLVMQARTEQVGATVEIVHESLLHRWPTLRKWREESVEDSTLLEQLRTAAKQWDTKHRPLGLLWRGEAMEEARRFHRRYRGVLGARERAYLDAVMALATRATRRTRRLVVAGFAFMAALVIAAVTALIWIRDAEREATREAERARTAESTATQEAERASAAERESAQRLEAIQQRDQAVARGQEDLRAANQHLATALNTATSERAKADQARVQAEDARNKADIANEKLRKILVEKEAELEKIKKANRKF